MLHSKVNLRWFQIQIQIDTFKFIQDFITAFNFTSRHHCKCMLIHFVVNIYKCRWMMYAAERELARARRKQTETEDNWTDLNTDLCGFGDELGAIFHEETLDYSSCILLMMVMWNLQSWALWAPRIVAGRVDFPVCRPHLVCCDYLCWYCCWCCCCCAMKIPANRTSWPGSMSHSR